MRETIACLSVGRRQLSKIRSAIDMICATAASERQSAGRPDAQHAAKTTARAMKRICFASRAAKR
jgi:hypothetical protein